jgi:drug/metabolite transporter (DMT)-like permease
VTRSRPLLGRRDRDLSLALWVIAARRSTFVPYLRRYWRLGIAGGIGTTALYELALWAMTLAPIAVVAALRGETSILFGTMIAGLVLKEPIGSRRVVAACIIAGGAAILRLV